MSWRNVRTLYWRELRSALRERGIVFSSIVVPAVLYPLLMWLVYTGFAYVSGQEAELTSRVALRNLPEAHRPLRSALTLEPDIEVVTSLDPEQDIRDGRLDLVIDFVAVQDAPSIEEGNVGARVTYDASRDESAAARQRVKNVLDRYRDRFIEREAAKLGFTRTELQGFRVDELNVSSEREMGRFALSLLLPTLLIVMFAVGAIYPAIDATAGERENGTWETLMSTAADRTDIVIAKYLYVATMSFVAGCLNVVSIAFTMRSSLVPLTQRPTGPMFQVPAESVPVLIAGAALLALFAAAGMMLLASFARSFREGQAVVSPFLAAFLLPIAFVQGPAQEFTMRMAFIPIINVALMFRQAIGGNFDWPLIGITLLIELLCVVGALRLASAILKHEDFMIGAYNGSFLNFVRHRLLRPAPAAIRGSSAR